MGEKRMKVLRRFKVLVSLLAMFSLFSLTNVSATEGEGKNFNKHGSEMKEEKEKRKKRENLKEEANKEKDINIKDININEEYTSTVKKKLCDFKEYKEKQKINKKSRINYNISNRKTKRLNIEQTGEENNIKDVNIITEEENNVKDDNIITEEENNIKDVNIITEEENNIKDVNMITEEELKSLSEKFLENFENFNFDHIFKNIMNRYGYYGEKQRLKLGCPYILVEPYIYKHKVLNNGKKTFVPYDYLLKEFNPDNINSDLFGEDRDLFSDFNEKSLSSPKSSPKKSELIWSGLHSSKK